MTHGVPTCPNCKAEAKEVVVYNEAQEAEGYIYFCATCNAPTEAQGDEAKVHPLRAEDPK